jgi:(p)ppGpp synthase/HD superfamily hydrolase
MKDLLEIRRFAFEAHAKTNHKYGDDLPYLVHLMDVANAAYDFQHLLPFDKKFRDKVFATCYLHDSIEDARLTYNDVLKATESEEVAEAVYALTNEKGRTRKERANDKYYEGIRNNKIASFVKLCDRIANMSFSKSEGSRMLEMYRKELPEFLEKTGAYDNYPEMVNYLKNI